MRKNERIARNEKKPMLPNFKMLESLVDLPGLVNDPKRGKLGPVRTSLSELVMFFFVCVCVLITNFMLGLITDDVFMHLGQVGSGQVN